MKFADFMLGLLLWLFLCYVVFHVTEIIAWLDAFFAHLPT